MIRFVIQKSIGLMLRIIGRVSPELASDLRFFRMFKRLPDRKHPRLFAEKLMLRSRSAAQEALAEYVDKWKVRHYVAQTIGDSYNVPLLGVYDRPEDIPYDSLPAGVHLKLNHASGYNLIYAPQKKTRIRARIRRWYRTDYSRIYQERQYSRVERKILVAEDVTAGGKVWDCSFFCFGGVVEFAQLLDHAGHRYEVGRSYEALPFRLFTSVTAIEPKPARFEEMVTLAEKLSRPFGFVRVDFFLTEKGLYFGELTFTPGAGPRRFVPDQYNTVFGDKIPDYILRSPVTEV